MLTRKYSAPTVKQHLAAIRRLFDWLIVGQVIDPNPGSAGAWAQARRQERQDAGASRRRSAEQLLDSIGSSNYPSRPRPSSGLRDRALIALLVYSFARISAALQMDVEDYYPQGKRWWLRLHEKGGKQHEMPAHHLLEHYLDAYVSRRRPCRRKNAPLFRTLAAASGRIAVRAVAASNSPTIA